MTEKLEENVVRYCLYPKFNVEEDELYLNYLNDCLVKLFPLLKNYFWYFESFNLNYIKSELSHNKVSHIEGLTNFDENIEDEWFIVYLLFEFSKLDENLIIHIDDTDGEFLLIEAAEYLPKWLNYKNSENRLFIQNGKLKLIPKTFKYKTYLSVENAINFIRNYPNQVECPLEIETEVKKRIEKYPFNSINKYFVYIPAAVATILNEDPKLINHAVRKFYSRDNLELAISNKSINFPPENMVKRLIQISKLNYAQLIGQKYIPRNKIDWNIPSENSKDFKYYDLGIKITCGFEILAALCKNKNGESSDNLILNNESYKKFLNCLEKNFYFKDLIKGSKLYTEKLDEAKKFFLNNQQTMRKDNDYIDNITGQKILDLKLNTKIDLERLKKEENDNLIEDSDDWLNEVPECLKNVDEERIKKIPQIFEDFLHEESGYEGIKLTKEKKCNSKLKNKAFEMMSENLRSILTMKVSESESDETDSNLSDYNYSSESNEEFDLKELKCLNENIKTNKKINENLNLNIDDNKLKKSVDNEQDKKLLNFNIKDYMKQMDIELDKTNVGKSFEKHKTQKVPIAEFDELSDDETCESVNIEVNTLKNILESFKSQDGLPGPAGNILSSYNLHLPKDEDDIS